MKKNTKKSNLRSGATKPVRRVIVLRELEDDDLSSATGGVQTKPGERPWFWE